MLRCKAHEVMREEAYCFVRRNIETSAPQQMSVFQLPKENTNKKKAEACSSHASALALHNTMLTAKR